RCPPSRPRRTVAAGRAGPRGATPRGLLPDAPSGRPCAVPAACPQLARRTATQALLPAKPKEFDRATSAPLVSAVASGRLAEGNSGSGVVVVAFPGMNWFPSA